MPMYNLCCNACKTVVEDAFLKQDEKPTATESDTPCTVCDSGILFRMISAPAYHWKAGEYGGDASRVNRVEIISKGVEEIDHKSSRREGKIMLKDSK